MFEKFGLTAEADEKFVEKTTTKSLGYGRKLELQRMGWLDHQLEVEDNVFYFLFFIFFS